MAEGNFEPALSGSFTLSIWTKFETAGSKFPSKPEAEEVLRGSIRLVALRQTQVLTDYLLGLWLVSGR